MTHVNPVPSFIAWMRKRRANSGLPWTDIAREFKRAFPGAALAVMEEIGSWPSSEVELRALQEVWP